MPNRILREGILTSPRMAKLGWPEEVFYRRLHSVVDDFGRYYADVGMLRAACYPRQLNKVSDSDVGKWLQGIEAAGLVRVYPAQDGERYLEVIDFGQQVRAKKSKFPDSIGECVATAAQLPSTREANAPVFVSVDVSVSEDVGEASKPPRPSKRCPESFEVTQDLMDWAAQEVPGVDWRAETKKFRDNTFKTAITDWPATWRNWLRRSLDFAPKAGGMSFRERDSAIAAARVHEMTGGLVSAKTPRPDALQEVFDAIPLKLAR